MIKHGTQIVPITLTDSLLFLSKQRCSSLERPLSATSNTRNNNNSVSAAAAAAARQCPSPIPAHITKGKKSIFQIQFGKFPANFV